MNTAMACFALHQYAEMLRLQGGATDRMSSILSKRSQLVSALQAVYDAKVGWYKRAYLGNLSGLGWRGGSEDGILWLEPNAWAVLSGVAHLQNYTSGIRENFDQHLRQRSAVGALFTSNFYPPEPEAYQGIWYCGNWVLVWSYGAPLVPEEANCDLAFEVISRRLCICGLACTQ